eukprot:g1753.t1
MMIQACKHNSKDALSAAKLCGMCKAAMAGKILASATDKEFICRQLESFTAEWDKDPAQRISNLIKKVEDALNKFVRKNCGVFGKILSALLLVWSEPTALWLAEAYMQYIAQNYSWIIANETIFNKVIQIDAYGKPYMHNIIINNQIRIKVSALALRFGAFIGKISKKIFSRQFSTVDGAQKISSVLEIGGGFGGLAVIAADVFELESYTIVDIPEALNVQKKFISHFPKVSSKIGYINGKKVHEEATDPNQEIAPSNYDLCISTYAFSELILEYRETYFETFVKKCKYGFFVDNGRCFGHLQAAHIHFGVAAMAERLGENGLIETEILDEVPSSTKGLNCNNYEFYFWPKKKEKPGDSRIANTKQAKNTPYSLLGVRRGDALKLADIHAAFEQRLIELKDAVSLLTNRHRLRMYEKMFFENLGDAGLACGHVCFRKGKKDCVCGPKLRKIQQKWQHGEIDQPLLVFWADNVFSQNGEDGIIRKIFDIIGTSADSNKSPRAIEFGAWDGFYLSNTAALWSQDDADDDIMWSAILIEADQKKYKKLKENLNEKGYSSTRVLPLLGMVGTGSNIEMENKSHFRSLESILEKAGILFDEKENEVALLSIDIDSHDLQVLNTLQRLRPRVIVCEFNPTLPPSVILHQKSTVEDGPRAFEGRHGMGASMGAIWGAAKRQRYTPVATTVTNVILVRDDLVAPILDLGFDVSFDSLRMISEHLLMYFATDFNGSPLLLTSNNYGPPFSIRKKPLDTNLIDSNFRDFHFPEITNHLFWIRDVGSLFCGDEDLSSQ